MFYQNFMVDVSHHIIEAYLIHRALLEKSSRSISHKAVAGDSKQFYTPLIYAPEVNTNPIIATFTIHDYHKVINNNSVAIHIEAFLSDLQVADASSCGRGITWIELYILYRYRGHSKPVADSTHKAISRATAAKQVRAFKKAVRVNIARTLCDSDHQHYFKPAKAVKGALLGVGI